MKLIIALFMLVAGTANAQGYRDIKLEGVTLTGYSSELFGNISLNNCESLAAILTKTFSYFSDDGLSLTYQGKCSRGLGMYDTDLVSSVRTNLPRGTYTLRGLCVANIDETRRSYAQLSNDNFQIILAKVETSKAAPSPCGGDHYSNAVLLKVKIK
jgi:hypothetical protein